MFLARFKNSIEHALPCHSSEVKDERLRRSQAMSPARPMGSRCELKDMFLNTHALLLILNSCAMYGRRRRHTPHLSISFLHGEIVSYERNTLQLNLLPRRHTPHLVDIPPRVLRSVLQDDQWVSRECKRQATCRLRMPLIELARRRLQQ